MSINQLLTELGVPQSASDDGVLQTTIMVHNTAQLRALFDIEGSIPSGHTTIAASTSLAVLGISSTTWRHRLAGPLLAWTVLTATATIALGWHRPSDVLGGLAVAALGYQMWEVPSSAASHE